MDDLQPPSRQKILIIRFSSIGDIVLTSPVVRAIKKQLPDVSLHFLTKKGFEPISKHNPHIDKVHVFTGNLQETLHELQTEKFDFVVDLQNNRRSHRITSVLGVPHQAFPKMNIKKWIVVNFKLNLLPDMHIVDRYFEAVKPLNVVNDNEGLDFFIPDNEVFDFDDLPAVFEDGYIAVSIAANHNTKRIPVDKIVEIGRLLYKPMLLLGGQDVSQIADEIVQELDERVYNGCGKFSLFTSASIINQSDCVLTGDTGLMHIAAALNKPIASVWGNTIPEFGMYPYMPNHRERFRIFETNALWCRPCSKLGFKKCPLKHFNCMNKLSVVEVAEWINRF
ncbi:glycosyltransferase family 9 protein [Bacteroidales bacterium OttesenSCG-928-B11]|nr:glycosyltransferase family 9 protein [Bacteroidales bacterium OttesenSCG-928-E04]MDL2312513.1 glycosyltransferase family 9 protein [Bacteroidales bacterium OttesenSCG-928-B11]